MADVTTEQQANEAQAAALVRWAASAECPAWLHEYLVEGAHSGWDGWDEPEERASLMRVLADMNRYREARAAWVS